MSAHTDTNKSTRRNSRTPAERAAARREEAKQLQSSIAEQVATLTTSDDWRLFLDYCRSFHRYSFNNVILIWRQCPTASRVAGYRKWQELGRQVRRNPTRIRIFGYSKRTITETDPTTGEEKTRTLVTYPPTSVFAFEDTVPIEGHPLAHIEAEHSPDLEGDDPTGITDQLTDWLTACGFTVGRGDTDDPDTYGFTEWKTRRVIVRDDLEPASAVHVLIHEAAHVLMHDPAGDDRPADKRQIEVEAESVAYVLAGLWGLDTSKASTPYIAGWSGGDADLIAATGARVLKAVDTIDKALTAP
ncbi:ArdC-like ssDNA-binding domain-containing protein [Tsukamurella sp. 8F]|uniref:ArdC-like ssDNA-binding domain-containing protein n=1 Tax=unclassified Tsukamurella TaxID=2633480 RepID=UPI0023B8BD07|nr:MULTISPECIES: ArdC-like ssDNA-binding domain-containing protein [unclassified Tsukamurella]MDF0532262.1 ArdC-like ssDNA-binding domain-containing protein [Tsukamurella sp. 8J]MDF0589288.1 ArdC-like ssDNA-binding domain-containing protein [Tsukamurella sp. 8F]